MALTDFPITFLWKEKGGEREKKGGKIIIEDFHLIIKYFPL